VTPRTPEVMIDLFPGLYPAGGIGRYVRDLAAALTGRPDAPPSRFAYPRNLRAVARARYAPERLRELPLGWLELRASILAGQLFDVRWDRVYGEPAVFHSTLGYGPCFRRTRLIAHVHDLTYLEHPEWHPWRTRAFLSATIPVAARRAATVLTHSEFVRGRVIEVFGVPRDRTITIPPPLGHAFHPIPRELAATRVAAAFGITGPFVLHVGTIEPRKNHVRLLGAFERMRRAGFPGPLVLVGKPGWLTAPIFARLESSRERASIRHLPEVSEDDLVALYGACTVCAFPSLEEGFGMPLLESMACGAACVISDHAALTELASGLAPAVPAHDEEALADAMLALWKDPARRERLGEDGRVRSADYRFERWAGRIFDLYRRELACASA